MKRHHLVLVALLTACLVLLSLWFQVTGQDYRHPAQAAPLSQATPGVTHFTGVDVKKWLSTAPQSPLTVVNAQAFTPTGTFQVITAASTVTPTITVGTTGQLLILRVAGTNTINLADSGTLMLTAAFAMGQYDTLVLICDGTNWYELARANN